MKGVGLSLALLMALASGCSSHPVLGVDGSVRHCPPQATAPAGSPTRSATAYERAIDAAAARGLQVWLEADLAKRWLEGCSSFEAGLQGLAVLAGRPGVVGIKIADELGYKDGFERDPRLIVAFLEDADRELRRLAAGRLILIDLLVPELGCAPGLSAVAAQSASCRARARALYPAITLRSVDAAIGSGAVDVVDLSTGLLTDDVYRAWGIDIQQAQEAAWHEAIRRGWATRVRLQARKALAHPGAYPYTSSRAASDLRLYVDIPRLQGAAGVDVWTWRQTYRGQIVRLMDPGLRPNALWGGLVRLHREGVVLFTHFTPSSVEQSVDADLSVLAQAFSAVFMAAGIG